MGDLVGKWAWFPCEVKPGPFSDERLVRLESAKGEWLIFAPIGALQTPVLEGTTQIRGNIVEIMGDRFLATFPGSALTAPFFEGFLAGMARP